MKKIIILFLCCSVQSLCQKVNHKKVNVGKANYFQRHEALMDELLTGNHQKPNNQDVVAEVSSFQDFNFVQDQFQKEAKLLAPNAYCQCGSALAVSGITLKAERETSEKVILKWKATELTTDNKYGIERSIDAKAFTNIDFLISKNNSVESDYTYEDANDNEVVTYYRIKENDLTGKAIYSNIVAVVGADGESKIIISPNPTSDKISISLVSESNSNGSFTFFTASGRQVLQKSILFEKGKNNTTIDISEFSVGTYFLQIDNGKNKNIKKVIKQ